MKDKKIEVLIIAVRDPRQRYRFISEPLQNTGLEYRILKDEGSFFSFIFNSFKYIHLRGRIRNILIIGSGLKNFVWYIINLFIGAKLIMREGGEPLLVQKIYIKGLIREGRLLIIIKAYIDYLIYIFLLKKVDCFILVNKSIYNSLQKIIKKNITYIVIPPVKHSELKYSRKYKESYCLKLLTVTNFVIYEKYTCLKKILSYIKDHEFGKFHYEIDILGGGPFLEDLETFVDQIPQNNRIRINLHGFVSNINSFLSKADIFFYVSTLDSTPNAILEAMSFGLPILLNNYKPFMNILNDEGARYFDLEDKNKFTKELYELSSKTSLRKRLGSNNIKNIQENYSKESIGKKIVKFLQEDR